MSGCMYVCMYACMHACKYMIVYFYLCIYAYIILTLFYLIGYLLFLHDLQCVMELYVTPASGGLRLFWLSSSSHQRWSQLQVRKVCGAARRRLGMFATFGRDKEFAECRAASQCLRAAYYGALPAEGQVSAPSWFHCIWLVKHTIL